MHVTYFDEVKADQTQGRDYYLVGGISLPMACISAIEKAMNDLALKLFGSNELTTDTEFHAHLIYRGRGPFKGMSISSRLEILGSLAEMISANANIRRVYAAIDVSKLWDPDNAPAFAFAHFVERTEMLIGKDQTTLLIGDKDDEQVKHMVRDFSKYRSRGTPWAFGIDINSIVDTVHFAQSHHSRMIQLADAYLFFVVHRWGGRKGPMADALTKLLADKELYPHRFKMWPK